ncbi:type B DNA-directed DNA polymerase [Halosegnis longus]|uniref:DNA-directed DNA polymerase n=1 Tax=Halosegnis longus TaxID=2216012 RepID=A0AAJ4R5Z9_9EURY|nr:type B DNA-directed DNA polymerase [Salella cibi]
MSLLTVEFRDGGVVEWHTTTDGVRTVAAPEYTPTMYVGGAESALTELATRLGDDPKVDTLAVEQHYTALGDTTRDAVLRVDTARERDIRQLATEIRHHHEPAAFQPATFRLYNVDFSPQFRYCLETETPPVPTRPLRTLTLEVPETALAADRVTPLSIDGEEVAGDAETTLRVLGERLRTTDPDVLCCSTAELVPLLETAAHEHGLDDFALGRRPGYEQLAGASTYESYGQVGHSPARYAVPGRAIIDTANSFMFDKGGLTGILDLVERSWKPIQETAWGSIGTILTAIQLREATARDVLAPWNKWEPERFKSVGQLHDGDRGGFIFAPEVGVHEEVAEVDFASLYPNIMCEWNISPETVACECHDEAAVPGLEYSLCETRGFIPDVLRPLIDDRATYKQRLAETDDSDERQRLQQRADALKWILVSCFGYQGYRNAKFGRIECHEAINAVARELMLDAKAQLEAGGWQVVHGIVDSLWVTPREANPNPLATLCTAISDDCGIPLEHENDFDWVAFVPKRDSEAGALTKYFGAVSGSAQLTADYKMRGIETRQRSTPPYIATVQERLIERYDETRKPQAVVTALAAALATLRAGEVVTSELVTTVRISQPLAAYDQATQTVAALKRLRDQGLSRSPGQDVEYVVVDDAATGAARVRLPHESPTTYDIDHYSQALIRAGVSVLAPLGYDERTLRQALRDTTDQTLDAYQ